MSEIPITDFASVVVTTSVVVADVVVLSVLETSIVSSSIEESQPFNVNDSNNNIVVSTLICLFKIAPP